MNSTHALKEMLKRPIAYHSIIAKAFGSVNLAILWCQLYYWTPRANDPDGWVYKTAKDLYDETGLSRREQETARLIGKRLGVMEEARRGVPATMHFKINEEKALELIGKFLEVQAKLPFDDEQPFSMKEELQKLLDSERRDHNIIAYYFQDRKTQFDTKAEFQVGLRRHLRAAKSLSAFSNEKIDKGMKEAAKQYPEGWTLETVIKVLTK